LLSYDVRHKAQKPFDYSCVYDIPKERTLMRFTRLLWFGYDEEGPAVYREDPTNKEIVRIDFLTGII